MVKYVTEAQIKALYRKKLRPRLKRMEIEQRSIRSQVYLLIGTFLTIFGALAYIIYDPFGKNFSFNSEMAKNILHYATFIFIAGSVIFFLIYKWLTKEFRNKFKQSIVQEMFSLLLQKSSFSPESHINASDFDRCDLITERYNRYNGEDHVTGRIGSIEVEFSELHVRHVTGSGKNKRDVTRFRGLFFKCTFDKKVRAPILIHSDVAERFFGKTIGRFLQKKSKSKYDLVQLESPEFEKLFAVYSTDQIHTRVILNPLTMDRLTQFIKKYKEKIEISVMDNYLYFLVHTNKDHFEPKIFSDALKWKDVMEIYDLLSLITELVNQFNLDKRVRNNAS